MAFSVRSVWRRNAPDWRRILRRAVNMKQFKLYIFDLNGTLTNTPFIDHKPLALLPGRAEKLAELIKQGAELAIASNQGGVAFGFTSEKEAEAEVAKIARMVGAAYYRVAFGHPKPARGYEQYASDAHLKMRKPAPGMLISIKREACLPLDDLVMIGDRREDEEAARAAGIAFILANDFFIDNDDTLKPT